MAMATHQVDIMQLPIHQLQTIRQEMEAEVGVLGESFGELKKAQIRFSAGLESLKPFVEKNEGLFNLKKGEKVLIPLTSTLYVPGTLANAKKVIVDVGTGYFAEKSVVDAKDFYQRKVDYLRQNLENLSATLEQKQAQHRMILEVIQYKFSQLQKDQPKKSELPE